MVDEQLLPTQTEGLPRYQAWSIQLQRLEILMNSCINSFTNLNNENGRAGFVGALMAMFIAISPQLKAADRKYIRESILVINNMVTSISKSSNTANTAASVEVLRMRSWELLTTMNLVKDRRGLGIPKSKETKWETELAEALDVNPNKKGVKKDEAKAETNDKAETEAETGS